MKKLRSEKCENDGICSICGSSLGKNNLPGMTDDRWGEETEVHTHCFMTLRFSNKRLGLGQTSGFISMNSRIGHISTWENNNS